MGELLKIKIGHDSSALMHDVSLLAADPIDAFVGVAKGLCGLCVADGSRVL